MNNYTKEEFLELIKGQSSIRGVARVLNCSKVKARSLLQNFEINLEQPQNIPDAKLLKELYIDQDLSSRKIANQLGLSRSWILRLLNKYDLIKEKPITNPYKKREKKIPTKKAINKTLLNKADYNEEDCQHDYSYKAYLETLPVVEGISISFYPSSFYQVNVVGKGFHQNMALTNSQFDYKIFQYEWDDPLKRAKIKNQIRNLQGRNEYKVFARKCEIKEVSNIEAKCFLEGNHLQGYDRSPIRLGLYYENDLVAIMTFCQPRFNNDFEYELGRFCCKANYNVTGGASRLFKYFLKNFNPSNIISYSDIAKTRGTMYSNLGFKLHRIAKPNYVWYNGNRYLTRYQCQKHKLLKRFPEFKSFSETEIMEHLGYYKVEDAGNKVWAYYNC